MGRLLQQYFSSAYCNLFIGWGQVHALYAMNLDDWGNRYMAPRDM